MAGKWRAPGVPHKGWTCTPEEVLGTPDQIFEMCETRDIRDVHHMEYFGWMDYSNTPGQTRSGGKCRGLRRITAPPERVRHMVEALCYA